MDLLSVTMVRGIQACLGTALILGGAVDLRRRFSVLPMAEAIQSPPRAVAICVSLLAMAWGLETLLEMGRSGPWLGFFISAVRVIQATLLMGVSAGIILDIILLRLEKERDQHRQREERSREFVREVIDSLDAQILVVDPDYRIRLVNRKLYEDLGMSEGELVGEPCHAILHRDCEDVEDCRQESEGHQCPWRAVRRTGEPVTMIHNHMGRDGQNRVMELMAFPVFDDGGEISYMVETLWDVTERTRLEEQAREKERLQGVLEMATAVAHEFNTPLFTVLGTAQLMLRAMAQDDPARGDLETIVKQCKRMGELTERMTQIDRYAAKEYVGDVRLLDIQAASDLLHHTEKMAALGQLTAAVAHEIANPLYLILGHAQLLLREYQAEDGLRRDLKQIEKSARICRSIVMNLLKVVRRESEGLEREDLNERLSGVLDLLEHAYALERVQIERDLGSNIPPVEARHDQLAQVYLNLLNNAFQAIEGGGTIRVRTRFSPSPGEVIVQVEDTGRGIPEDVRSRIFEPFFTTKEAGVGTGLGLSVSKEIVERHGGTISVEGEEGEGSCFTIRIPVRA